MEIKNLSAKIAAIVGEMGAIEKKGRNSAQNYTFVGYEQFYAHLRPLLEKYKIAIFPEVVNYDEHYFEKGDKVTVRTVVRMTHTIVDSETGESVTCHSCGAANDTGDKSMGKAITECDKRWLFKLFKVSSVDDVDPDGDDGTGGNPPSRPTPPPAPKTLAAPAAPAPAAPAQTTAAPSPVDNYRKHFLKVLQENKRVGSEPGKVDIIGLGKYCLKNYGAGMDGLNIDQMKSTLNMLKEKGHIPANTEV